jgi:hypothetical protein
MSAEPSAGQQAYGHREDVARAQPLDQRLGRAEVPLDGRTGDRRHQRVEKVHDLGGEDHEEGGPAPAVGRRLGGGRERSV